MLHWTRTWATLDLPGLITKPSGLGCMHIASVSSLSTTHLPHPRGCIPMCTHTCIARISWAINNGIMQTHLHRRAAHSLHRNSHKHHITHNLSDMWGKREH